MPAMYPKHSQDIPSLIQSYLLPFKTLSMHPPLPTRLNNRKEITLRIPILLPLCPPQMAIQPPSLKIPHNIMINIDRGLRQYALAPARRGPILLDTLLAIRHPNLRRAHIRAVGRALEEFRHSHRAEFGVGHVFGAPQGLTRGQVLEVREPFAEEGPDHGYVGEVDGSAGFADVSEHVDG